jgi:hypothetical protein
MLLLHLFFTSCSISAPPLAITPLDFKVSHCQFRLRRRFREFCSHAGRARHVPLTVLNEMLAFVVTVGVFTPFEPISIVFTLLQYSKEHLHCDAPLSVGFHPSASSYFTAFGRSNGLSDSCRLRRNKFSEDRYPIPVGLGVLRGIPIDSPFTSRTHLFPLSHSIYMD